MPSFARATMTSQAVPYMRKNACKCAGSPVTCVGDDEILTQYAASATSIRTQPRETMNDGQPELSMSLLRGRLTRLEAFRYVRGRLPTESELQRILARYTRAGRLREAGFAVVHTPGRILQGIHVSVVWPNEDPLDRQDIPWPEGVPERFDRCFTEVCASLEGGERNDES